MSSKYRFSIRRASSDKLSIEGRYGGQVIIMNNYQKLEKRVIAIEQRNRKVEIDKEWETSKTRRLLLVLFTYLAIAFYLKYILHIDPWLNAIVPSIGFLLSTLTFPFLKKLLEKFIHSK